MATLTGPGDVQEDTRGDQLARHTPDHANRPLDQQGAKALDPGEQAKLDQIQAGLSEPIATNHAAPASTTPDTTGSTSSAGAGSSAISSGGGSSSGSGGPSGLAKAGKFASKHKKGIGIGVGVLGAILGGILAIFGFLADKMYSMMANIYRKEMAKIEHAVERRTEKMVLNMTFNKATGKLAAEESPLLQKLYDKVPIDKIEAELANRGFTVTPEGSGVHVVTPDGNHVFANADEFNTFFDSDAAAASRNMVDQATEVVTHSHETYQRRFLRLLMRDKFDVKKWTTYEGEEDKDGKTAATDEVKTSLEHATIDPVGDTLGADLSCITGSDASCPPTEQERPFPDGNAEGHPTWESTLGEKSGTATDTDPCADKSAAAACDKGNQESSADKQSITDGLEAENHAADNEVAKAFDSQLLGEVAKGANILGMINILADVDSVISVDKTGNNKISKLIAARRELQYAGLFAKMLSMADQMKTGNAKGGKHVTGSEVNATMKLLDSVKKKDGTVEPGIEGSNAFSRVFNNDPTRGKKLDGGKLVGSKVSADGFSSWYSSSIGVVLHPVLAAYKATVGKVLSWIGDVFGSVINLIPGVSNFTKWLSGYAAKFLNYILGTVVDGTETGATLMNATDAGGDVTANAFANSLGAPAVSDAAAAQISSEIAYEDNQNRARLPLAQRLFDGSDPQSLRNQIAVRLPSSVDSATSQSTSYIASLFINPAQFFGGLFGNPLLFAHAYAADTTDPYGVQQHAYTNGQLAGPLQLPTADIGGKENPDGSVNHTPDGVIDQYDCPRVADSNVANECLLDTAALMNLGITSTNDDNGGLGGTQ